MPTTLNTLPPELRLKIYRNLFVLSPIKVISNSTTSRFQNSHTDFIALGPNGLDSTTCKASAHFLRVCRLFFEEGTSVLYGENEFAGQSRRVMNGFLKVLEAGMGGKGYMDLIRKIRFGHLEGFGNKFGFAILERAAQVREVVIEGYIRLDEAEMKAWDEAVAVKKGDVVTNGSVVHEKFPAFPRAKMERFGKRGVQLVAKARLFRGWVTYVSAQEYVSTSTYPFFSELERLRSYQTYEFRLVAISKQRVKEEGLARAYDLVFLGSELIIPTVDERIKAIRRQMNWALGRKNNVEYLALLERLIELQALR